MTSAANPESDPLNLDNVGWVSRLSAPQWLSSLCSAADPSHARQARGHHHFLYAFIPPLALSALSQPAHSASLALLLLLGYIFSPCLPFGSIYLPTLARTTCTSALIERAQFAHNPRMYTPSGFADVLHKQGDGFDGSWLDWLLRETETSHGECSVLVPPSKVYGLVRPKRHRLIFTTRTAKIRRYDR